MSFRPPDWERRLRDLERRADNRGTDIVRLWGRLPQAPELPGYAMPVIIPSSTTPTPTTTTTTTSTTSTTTSSTTTSSTTTTVPPLTCLSKWPQSVTLSVGEFYPSDPAYVAVPTMGGIWMCDPISCTYAVDNGRTVTYQSPPTINHPAFPGNRACWFVEVSLWADPYYPGTGSQWWWGASGTVWSQCQIRVSWGIQLGVYVRFVDPDINGGVSFSNASGLLGDTYSLPRTFLSSTVEDGPTSCTVDFSSVAIP